MRYWVKPIRTALFVLLTSLGLVVSGPGAFAQSDEACEAYPVISTALLTDICWDCLFPIRMFGVTLFGSDDEVPDGASDRSSCLCFEGLLPELGYVRSHWEPSHIVEVVRAPGCSTVLGGAMMPSTNRLNMGTRGHTNYDAGDLSFRHVHVYSFPLLVMLEIGLPDHCVKNNYLDFDLLYLSELDPTWNHDELAFFTHPEAALVANPAAQAACVADALSSNLGRSVEELWWCAGSWGWLYPMTGHHAGHQSFQHTTSLLATRMVAAMHRRGLMVGTMGNDALCEGEIATMLPKEQYRMSMFSPVPEALDNHVIGESPFTWRPDRHIPGVGEDASYLLWHWNDCCSTY